MQLKVTHGSYVVTLLNQTPMFEWYQMLLLVINNGIKESNVL